MLHCQLGPLCLSTGLRMSRSLGSLGQPALLLLTTLLRPSLFPLPMERRLLTAPRGVPTLGPPSRCFCHDGLGLKAALLRDGLSSGLPRIGLWRLFLNGLRLVASGFQRVGSNKWHFRAWPADGAGPAWSFPLPLVLLFRGAPSLPMFLSLIVMKTWRTRISLLLFLVLLRLRT